MIELKQETLKHSGQMERDIKSVYILVVLTINDKKKKIKSAVQVLTMAGSIISFGVVRL